MNQLRMAVVIGSSLLALSVADAKGPITRILIEGDYLPAPIEITDASILDKFSVWDGPGVGMRDFSVAPDLSEYVDNREPNGRFVDWPKGFADSRPDYLQRLEVTLFVGVPQRPDRTRKFVFAYEVDWDAGRGFIYLPRWKNDLIWHGVELNWLHAHARWDQAIMPIIETHTDSVTGRRDLACTVGRGSLHADGTIEFDLIDENGVKRSRWTYDRTTSSYENVRALIGDAQPWEEIGIPCWPAR